MRDDRTIFRQPRRAKKILLLPVCKILKEEIRGSIQEFSRSHGLRECARKSTSVCLSVCGFVKKALSEQNVLSTAARAVELSDAPPGRLVNTSSGQSPASRIFIRSGLAVTNPIHAAPLCYRQTAVLRSRNLLPSLSTAHYCIPEGR